MSVQILATLTTAPAARFGMASRTGRLKRGLAAADIVVLDGDFVSDIRALATVHYCDLAAFRDAVLDAQRRLR